MTRIEKSTTIRASPETVWDLLAWDRVKEWMGEWRKNLKSMEYTSEVRAPEDKYRVGTSAHVNLKGMGMGEFDLEITESVENEKMTYRTKRSGNNQQIGLISFLLKPVEGGTHFTYVYDYVMPGGTLGKFLNKLGAQRSGEKMLEKDVENLKSLLEK